MATCIRCGSEAGFLSEVCVNCKQKNADIYGQDDVVRPQLSSVALVRKAATEIYNKRAVLSLAVILPILCSSAIRMTCVAYVCYAPDDRNLALVYLSSFARVPFYVMFATICHRIVLLGEDSLSNRWGLFWSVRETRFFGWLVVLGLIPLVIYVPISYSVLLLPLWALEWYVMLPSYFFCVLVSTYIDGRFGLVLPATAVGKKMSLRKSWKFSAGNGWTIFIALLIPILITELIDYVVFDLLFDTASLIVNFLRGLLYYPLIAIGVIVITIAYRELVALVDGENTA